jgi:iron complex outermembrane receptor protein
MRKSVSLLAAIAAALPLSVRAEDTATTGPVVVTATRLDELANMPASVTVITSEDIARSPAKSLPDLLALEAGVNRSSLFGNFGTRDAVDMRGFGAAAGQNTLILLDGRRLSDVDLAAVDFPAIPLQAIERIEILRGSGTVLYGDGAVGGAINIVTRGPGRAGTRGSARLGAGSYDTRALDADVSHAQGGFSASLFANHLRTDGYRDNNDLEQTNLLADLRWQEHDREWFLKLGGDEQDLRLPGARRMEPGAGIDELANDRRGTSTPDDYAKQDGRQLTAGVLAFLSGGARLTVDGGYRRKHQQANLESGASYLDSELATWSFTPRLTVPQTLLGSRGSATVGVDYYRSAYDSDRSESRASADTPIHRIAIEQRSLALYGQIAGEVAAGTHLSAGARTQRVDLEANDSFDPTAPGAAFESEAADLRQDDQETAYELGLRHHLDQRLSVFARLGRSNRFATVDELFEFDSTTFLRVFSPLKPQTADSIELGTDYVRGDRRISASAYRMNLRNEIHFNPNTFTNDNLDPTRRYGFALSAAEHLADTVRVKADYTYTRSEFRAGTFEGNDVPLVPRHTGALTLAWDVLPKATLSASARYTGPKRFDNDQSNTFEKIPQYTIVDVKFVQALGAWQWQAAVNNAFNEEAFDYGIRSVFTPGTYNAYPLPERNYSLSVAREF